MRASLVLDEACFFCNWLIVRFVCLFVCFILLIDYKRLLNQPHHIGGHVLVVEPHEEMLLDPKKLYVEELNPNTSNEYLTFYLENVSGVDVEDVQKGCNNNAMITFESEPGNIWSYKK